MQLIVAIVTEPVPPVGEGWKTSNCTLEAFKETLSTGGPPTSEAL